MYVFQECVFYLTLCVQFVLDFSRPCGWLGVLTRAGVQAHAPRSAPAAAPPAQPGRAHGRSQREQSQLPGRPLSLWLTQLSPHQEKSCRKAGPSPMPFCPAWAPAAADVREVLSDGVLEEDRVRQPSLGPCCVPWVLLVIFSLIISFNPDSFTSKNP